MYRQQVPKQGEVWAVDLGINVGDVMNKVRPCIIVSYDEYRTDESVVLGFLFREALDSISNATLQDLIVESSAVLPEQTTIGEVKASELKHLSGITGNIQKQLNSLQQQINNIEEKLN